MEKRTMNTTIRHPRNAPPATFSELVGGLMPTAIHDKVAYENAMEMVRRLAVVPLLNDDQLRYLETLTVLVADYERKRRTVGKAKPKPLKVLREFTEEHGMKVRDLGGLLGVSESAASMILRGERGLTLDHVRKLAERFKVSAALFVG